jgi:hypothetical protein
VAAVTIAVLLLWSLDGTFQALWSPLSRIGAYLFTAAAILDIPYFNPKLNGADRLMLMTTLLYLSRALINLFAAWLLSRWVYGVGPLHSLRRSGARFIRGNHV